MFALPAAVPAAGSENAGCGGAVEQNQPGFFPPCPRGEKGKPKGTGQGTAGGWQEQRNLLALCIWEEKVKNASGTQQRLSLAGSAHPAGTQDLGFDP